jgi:RNA polymerase sigma factor (sigma-70 family)
MADELSPGLPVELIAILGATDEESCELAWARFMAKHSRLVLHVARTVEHDHDSAMDGYACVLERLREHDCRRLRAYVDDGHTKFSTWLVVVARRICIDRQRQRYGRARDGQETSGVRSDRDARRRLLDLVAEEVDLTRLLDPSGSTPERELRALELHRSLADALAALGTADRLTLALRFEDGRSASEIALMQGFPSPFHVYRRLNHLFATLRAALERHGVKSSLP